LSAAIVTTPSLSVSDAIQTRRSVRAFRKDAVDQATIREMLEIASRSASGGNLQPWKIHVLAGAARDALVDAVAERSKERPFGDGPEYAIYPPDLGEPYKARRGRVAHQMYELAGIARDDTAARAAQMGRNFQFFGAPIGMIVSIDREMGPPQYADLGIFLQSLMLLARERGLHSCPQEAWSLWGATIREIVGIPEEELIFCGLSLGYADDEAVINRLQSERASVDEFAHFAGF
jgi:nitroreductase